MRFARTRSPSNESFSDWLRLVRERGAIDLAVGTPGAPTTPKSFIDAACAAIKSGNNQYEDPFGSSVARASLAESLGWRPDPESELTITVGATEALSVALLALVEPGDEVIVFEPFYPHFREAVALAGGRCVPVRLRPPVWSYDERELRKAFGPRTRVLLLNTPHNPTGRVWNRAELTEIAALCGHWDVTTVSDEVYAGFAHGTPHLSPARIPGLADRTVVIGSLSKSHSISGWRQGFLWAPAEASSVLRRIHVILTGGAPGPLQQAFVQLPEVNRSDHPDLGQQRGLALEAFTAFGLECYPTEGGCYFLAGTRGIGRREQPFAEWLLDSYGVGICPGGHFYLDPAQGANVIRVAFNKSPETIRAAATAMNAGFTIPCESGVD